MVRRVLWVLQDHQGLSDYRDLQVFLEHRAKDPPEPLDFRVFRGQLVELVLLDLPVQLVHRD